VTPRLTTSKAWISVRTLLPLALGALILVLLVPIMAAGYYGARDNTRRLLQSTSDAIVDGLEDQLRGTLDPVAQQMATVARAIAAGRVDPTDREGFRRFMLGVLTGQQNVVGIGFLEPEGPFRRWQRDGLDEIVEPRASAPFADEIMARARDGGGARWNRPFVSMITHSPLLLHLQPVSRGGRLLGVMMTALTTEAVSDAINSMNPGVTPFVLVDRETVVIHPNMRTAMLGGPVLPTIRDMNDKALSLLWTDPREPTLVDKNARSRTHWTWLGEGYQAQQYHYRVVEGYGPDPWIIGYHVDTRSTMRERWVVQALLYGAIFAVALVLLASWFIGRRAAGPATAMAMAAERFEALDFDGVTNSRLQNSRIVEYRQTFHALSRAALALRRIQTYVPRALVSRLITLGDDRPNAVDCEVTILFMDLAGYTAFSEGRNAAEVASYLNGVFARIGPVIEELGGTIDKYTGDGLLAVWGAPTPDADHARRAFEAARRMHDIMSGFFAEALARDPRSCRMRIGLHSGRVLAGDLGFLGRMDFTVVGRTVNTAQRTQAALKGRMGEDPVAIAVTLATLTAIGTSDWRFTPLGVNVGGEDLYRAAPESDASGITAEGLDETVMPSRAIAAPENAARRRRSRSSITASSAIGE
jgi:class 3 adenylate cyclase